MRMTNVSLIRLESQALCQRDGNRWTVFLESEIWTKTQQSGYFVPYFLLLFLFIQTITAFPCQWQHRL